MKNKIKISESLNSWKTLFKFYKKVKIPWLLVLCVFILSFAVKEAESQLVPFNTKIMTGAITEHGFLGGFVFVTILYEVIEALQGSINELCGVATTRNVRFSIWRKLIHLPMSVFDKHEPQSLVSRITQDTTGAYAAIACVIQFWAIVYGIYINYVRMARVYHELALVMLSAIPITIISSFIVGKMQYKMERITNNAYAKITNFFGERLPNLTFIKTSGMEKEEYEKGVKENDDKYRADLKREKLFIVQQPISSFAMYFNMIVLLVVASGLVRAGVMRMAQMVNLYNYFMLFMGNAFMITAVWQSLKMSHGACATIAELSEMEDELLDAPVHTKDDVQDITFKNISFSYDNEVDILKDVSFVIPKGKTTVLVGENGSGKSTIVKLLLSFNIPSFGEIKIGDDSFADVSLYDWRAQVGYLSQNNAIIKGTLRDNVLYGIDREVSEEELIDVLKRAKAYDFIMEKDHGLDTEISHFDSKLSGGEMQRIAIARIMLKKPQYLIMDEATSGVDIVNEEAILDELHDMMENKTIIMISHNMELIRQADNIIVLNNGVIEASGSFDEVSRNSALFRKFECA